MAAGHGGCLAGASALVWLWRIFDASQQPQLLTPWNYVALAWCSDRGFLLGQLKVIAAERRFYNARDLRAEIAGAFTRQKQLRETNALDRRARILQESSRTGAGA